MYYSDVDGEIEFFQDSSSFAPSISGENSLCHHLEFRFKISPSLNSDYRGHETEINM